MIMFDGHILPNGTQPLVFDRATHALTPNCEAITDTFARTLKPFLANSSIQTVMVGDEIVCSGTPFALFETVVTRLRTKLDAVTQELGQPEVIMYTNECNDVFFEHLSEYAK